MGELLVKIKLICPHSKTSLKQFCICRHYAHVYQEYALYIYLLETDKMIKPVKKSYISTSLFQNFTIMTINFVSVFSTFFIYLFCSNLIFNSIQTGFNINSNSNAYLQMYMTLFKLPPKRNYNMQVYCIYQRYQSALFFFIMG